jgi:hypothetical protein
MEERDIIAGLLLVLDWVGDGLGEDNPDDHERHIKYLFETKWIQEFYPERESAHCGDCTNVPVSCIRCQIDNYYRLADILIKSHTIPSDWGRENGLV